MKENETLLHLILLYWKEEENECTVLLREPAGTLFLGVYRLGEDGRDK